MSDVQFADNPDTSRYELYVDGQLASFADYRLTDGQLAIDHVETRATYRGIGLAEQLVRYVLDEARTQNRTVVPRCSFAADVIRDNPEYHDVVA